MYAKFEHAVELGKKARMKKQSRSGGELASAHPDDERICNNLGRCPDPHRPLRRSDRAIRKGPGNQSAVLPCALNWGEPLKATAGTRAAMREYQLALDSYPDSADLHLGFGRTLEVDGKIDRRCAEFARAIELQPHPQPRTTDLALPLLDTGKPDQAARAEAEFNRALELAPETRKRSTTSVRSMASRETTRRRSACSGLHCRVLPRWSRPW